MFSLHMCAMGPNPAAAESVLCSNNACILRLFSMPSSLLLASWVQFRCELGPPPRLAPCNGEVHQSREEDQVSKGQVLLGQEDRKSKMSVVQVTDFILERHQVI